MNLRQIEPGDGENFVPGLLTGHQFQISDRKVERLGQKFPQRCISFPFQSGSLHFDFDRLAVKSHDFAAAGIGHHAETDRGFQTSNEPGPLRRAA